MLDVTFEPFELPGAELAEPASLEVDDVHEADEVDAVLVEETRSGMAFWAVSDLNDAELSEFVRALQDTV